MAHPRELRPPEPVRWSVLAPVFAVLLIVVPLPAWIVEELYSRDTYPWLQDVLTGGTNLLPFAFLDVLLLGLMAAAGYRAIRLFNVMIQRGIIDAIWEGIRRVIRAAAVIVILFCWAWGFNYRRPPLEAGLPGGRAIEPTQELFQAGIADASSLATRLRPLVRAGRELTYPEVAQHLHPFMNDALARLGRPALARAGDPKYSFVLTPFFTAAGINGMINPIGLESIVHPELLPYERPFVLAHEWAHLSGQGDEAEASAVGWLACMLGEAPFAYSASLYLILEASAGLPAEPRRASWARLDAGVRADIDAIIARMRREQPTVQRTASRVYDEYLLANRVEDGTASYGRALSLVLSPALRDVMAAYDTSK